MSQRGWTVVCDLCGWEFPNTVMKRRWDGLVVCPDDFETDHPQKYLSVRADPKHVPQDLIRQEGADRFIDVDYIWDKHVGESELVISGHEPTVQLNAIPFGSVSFTGYSPTVAANQNSGFNWSETFDEGFVPYTVQGNAPYWSIVSTVSGPVLEGCNGAYWSASNQLSRTFPGNVWVRLDSFSLEFKITDMGFFGELETPNYQYGGGLDFSTYSPYAGDEFSFIPSTVGSVFGATHYYSQVTATFGGASIVVSPPAQDPLVGTWYKFTVQFAVGTNACSWELYNMDTSTVVRSGVFTFKKPVINTLIFNQSTYATVQYDNLNFQGAPV